MTDDFDFLTDKSDLARAHWAPAPEVRLPPDGVVVEIERFGLTANNLTYAKAGEVYGFWRYFPAPDGFGRMPVWGLARVVQSANPSLPEGERIYGFLPISTRLALTPEFRAPFGVVDVAPHRADLTPTYNEYRLIDRDPGYDRENESLFLALRPLFSLGFLLAEWLEEQTWFGCQRVVVSSASSKAAGALAHRIAGRVETIGLTSERHVVESMRAFDRVLAYSALAGDASLAARPGLFVDIAGDPAIAGDVRRAMGDRLVRSIGVGTTRGDASQLRRQVGESGPNAEFFFAPTHLLRLRQAWGEEAYSAKAAVGWAGYAAALRGRLAVETYAGRAEIAAAYEAMAKGAAPANVVTILADAHVE